jgi:MFS family permease
VHVPSWFVLRFVMALGLGLALVVSETWINALAPPEKRGAVIGIYIAVFSAGLATGPLIIGITGSEGALPFLVIALVMAVSILPIPLASRGGAPTLLDHAPMSLRQAFRQAPVVMVASLLIGVIWLTTMALLPVYGVRSGLAEDQALILLTAYIIGNIGFQFPIGRLLDRWNAPLILAACGVVQVLGLLAIPLVVDMGALAWLILAIWGGFLGGAVTTSMTMLGRVFTTEQLSGANSAFALALEVGGLVGPLLAGLAMQIWDPHGMLVVIGVAGAGLAWVALRSYREGGNPG